MSSTPTNPRYLRQQRLAFWDQHAQARLESSHAMIIGVGALGCPCADLLARAGVGRITLIDRDLVDRTNLHRQTLFCDEDATEQRPKATAAAERLRAVNPEIDIEPLVLDFSPADAEHILLHERFAKPDIIIDGCDNFETRYLINDLSVKHSIPYVYAGAIATSASAAVFTPPDGPCLRCLFPEPPPIGSGPTCESVGVFSPVSAIIASYQASESLKLLMGRRDHVMKSFLKFDLWEGSRVRIDLSDAKDPACPCCGLRHFEYLDQDEESTQSICGKDAIQINPNARTTIDLDQLTQKLNNHGEFRRTGVLTRGVLDDSQIHLTVFYDGRAILDGIDDPSLARAIYARYIGC